MIDWLNSTSQQRRAFYKVVKRYLDERHQNWVAFLDQAYGDAKISATAEDQDNFRKGTIGAKRVNLVYRWFERNEPVLADIIASGEQHYDEYLSGGLAPPRPQANRRSI